MSLYEVARLCRAVNTDTQLVAALLTDPGAAVASYELTEWERFALLTGDVAALHRHGVHGLLLSYLTHEPVLGLDFATYSARMREIDHPSGALGGIGTGLEQHRRTSVPVTPDVVARYVTALNANDWSTIARCFTQDAEFVSVGIVVARGGAAIATHLESVMSSLPDHHDEPTRLSDSGRLLALWMKVTGRTPDQRPLAFDAVDLIELSPDRQVMTRLETWWDTASLQS